MISAAKLARIGLAVLAMAAGAYTAAAEPRDLASLVDPFMGAEGGGNTAPGASVAAMLDGADQRFSFSAGE